MFVSGLLYSVVEFASMGFFCKQLTREGFGPSHVVLGTLKGFLKCQSQNYVSFFGQNSDLTLVGIIILNCKLKRFY